MAGLKNAYFRPLPLAFAGAVMTLTVISGCARLPPRSAIDHDALGGLAEAPMTEDGSDSLASLAPAALREQSNTPLQLRYATALAVAGRNQEALNVAKAALGRDKTDASAERLVGRLNIRLGNATAARMAYQDVLSRVPDDLRSLNGLGIAYVMEMMLPNAEATFRRAVTVSPTDGGSRSNLALALALEGKTAEAIPMLEAEVHQGQPSDRDRTNLALAYAVAGSRDKAIGMLRPRMTAAEANAFIDAYAPHGAPDADRIVLRAPPRAVIGQ